MHEGRESKANRCLYFRWTALGWVLWLSWVDDCLVGGKDEAVMQAKGSSMMELFDCDNVGELKEYGGCKVDYNQKAGTMKQTPPVVIQTFQDKFKLPEGKSLNTPVIPGNVMSKGELKNQVGNLSTIYQSEVRKLLYMMRWTRPEMIMNPVRELSRFTRRALQSHVMAMYWVMKNCQNTPE
jgi:hypothetical protein